MNAVERYVTLERIARETLGFVTLDTRKADALDFRDCAVWNVSDALHRAYLAGFDAASEVRSVGSFDTRAALGELGDTWDPLPDGPVSKRIEVKP